MEYQHPGLFDEVVHLIHKPMRDDLIMPQWYWGGPTREAHFKHIRDIALKHT